MKGLWLHNKMEQDTDKQYYECISKHVGVKKDTKLYTTWFHLNEVLEQDKQIYTMERKKNKKGKSIGWEEQAGTLEWCQNAQRNGFTPHRYMDLSRLTKWFT